MKYFIFTLIMHLSLHAELPPLNINDIELLKKEISKLESLGQGGINAENMRGYLGKYQFGAAALASVGLVNKEKYNASLYYDKKAKTKKWKVGVNNKSFLAKNSNWELNKGKNSFLGNRSLQELAMNELINQNYLALSREPLTLKKQELFGFLIAAHLGGYTHALNYIKNKTEFKDGFGTSISKYYLAGTKLRGSMATPKKEVKKKLEKLAKQHLGKKYKWGGETPSGFDCSGFTQYIFNQAGISLPRTALEQSKLGSLVSREQLQKGDLLFFLTDKSRKIPITHVGIYLGNNEFIHAASKAENVTISKMKEYKDRFVLAKRVDKLKSKDSKTYATNSYRYEIIDGKYQRVN